MDITETFVRRDEKFDLAKILELILQRMQVSEPEKHLSLVLTKFSEDDRIIIKGIQNIQENTAKQIVPFYERRKDAYLRCIGRSLFSRNADLIRERQSSELAMQDLKKMLSVADSYLRKNIQQVAEAHRVLASSFSETAGKLFESVKGGIAALPAGEQIQPGRLEVLEEKVEKLVAALLPGHEVKKCTPTSAWQSRSPRDTD